MHSHVNVRGQLEIHDGRQCVMVDRAVLHCTIRSKRSTHRLQDKIIIRASLAYLSPGFGIVDSSIKSHTYYSKTTSRLHLLISRGEVTKASTLHYQWSGFLLSVECPMPYEDQRDSMIFFLKEKKNQPEDPSVKGPPCAENRADPGRRWISPRRQGDFCLGSNWPIPRR